MGLPIYRRKRGSGFLKLVSADNCCHLPSTLFSAPAFFSGNLSGLGLGPTDGLIL
jgi:hypothetical protein